MATDVLLSKKSGVQESIHSFFRGLLERGIVDTLLVPQKVAGGRGIVHTLVRSVSGLREPDVTAPLLLENSAKLISSMTLSSPSPVKMGVVMRPCEIKALVELIKLKQANLENLTIIGVDCLGTIDPREYMNLVQDHNGDISREFLKTMNRIPQAQDYPLRTACKICLDPAAHNSHVTICLLGIDPEKEFAIEVGEDRQDIADLVVETLAGERVDDLSTRADSIRQLVETREAARDALLKSFAENISDFKRLAEEFALCIGCHACRRKCPICFCRECIFDTAVLEIKGRGYLARAKAKGAVRMPTDIMLFHLTRLNHMVASCVSCGMCSTACPQGLPVADLFITIGEQVQKMFSYEPGRSTEDELPLSVFREDELEHVTSQDRPAVKA